MLTTLENLENSGNLLILEKSGKAQGILNLLHSYNVEDFGVYSCNLFRVGSIFCQAVQYSTVLFLCIEKLETA